MDQDKDAEPAAAPAPARPAASAPARPNADEHLAIHNTWVELRVVLGSSSMPIGEVLKLGRGAVLPLDRMVGEPLDVFVKGVLIARGEVTIVEEKLAVTLTRMVMSMSDH
ncbi:MAG: FliM/FliN family flagellar motor switch protein [Proteobacteria bacterium]|nr:FliM/FliN family flagellar motor switch protein [Pseudomonadota bacterium]MBI3500092.1 FliM/FliN family flagellar motor switch protein [Pseudomonadota bacterium]